MTAAQSSYWQTVLVRIIASGVDQEGAMAVVAAMVLSQQLRSATSGLGNYAVMGFGYYAT